MIRRGARGDSSLAGAKFNTIEGKCKGREGGCNCFLLLLVLSWKGKDGEGRPAADERNKPREERVGGLATLGEKGSVWG